MTYLPLIIAVLAGFVAWGLVYYGWTLWDILSEKARHDANTDMDDDIDEGGL